MESKKFSLKDVVVLKENEVLDCEQLSAIIGGISPRGNDGCICKCGTNSAALGSGSGTAGYK
ncbi:MAG: hypothetical protein LBP63_06575 [Prevotellaceae bacterium]|jgi:hypothetical protein|nr:hypothetical protein [Prevotellaceae bacterium]